MKTIQKSLALLLALCMIVAFCPVLSAYAETSGDVVSDTFGDGFRYVYNKFHALLIVHGEGPLVLPDPEPWEDYKGSVRRIIVDEGVTAIPAGAFSGCGKLASVVLPLSLESLDPEAFADCGIVSYVMSTGSTGPLSELLKEAGIKSFRDAAVTRTSAASIADEIDKMESGKAEIDYYYPNPDKRTLEQIKEQMFRDALQQMYNQK